VKFPKCALSAIVLALAFVACSGGEEATEQTPQPVPQSSPSSHEGEVITTMDSGGYTYVEVKTDSGTIWAAGPVTKIEVGEQVVIQSNMLMQNFTSESLDRTFDEIYFVSGFGKPGASSAPHDSTMPPGHPSVSGDAQYETKVDIAKADGGYTVAEIWEKQEELRGKEVVVRGQVTKFLPNIMKRNWIHIADGSGMGATSDLTITSDQTVKLGDVVLVRGTLARNKDFGAGYRYDVILEQAKITVE